MDEVDTEIAEIQQTMRSNYGEYAGNPGMQARYGELLTAREAGTSPEAVNPVDAEIMGIKQRMREDFAGYQNDVAQQGRYLQLLSAPEAGAAGPLSDAPAFTLADLGNPVEVLSEYREAGKYETAEVLARGGAHHPETNVQAINLAALNVVYDIGEEDGANNFLEAFNHLPDRAQAQTFDALLTGSWDQPAATPAELQTFVDEDDAGEALVAEWGDNAAFRLGVVKARTAKIFANLSVDEKRQLEHFITSAPEAEWLAVLRQLGNPEPVHMRAGFKKMKGAA